MSFFDLSPFFTKLKPFSSSFRIKSNHYFSCISKIHLVHKHSQSYLSNGSFSSVPFSHSVVSDSLRPHEPQHTRAPCPSPTPGVHQNPCPSSQWWHPTFSPPSSPSPLAPNPSQHQGLFQWVSPSHEVAKVLEFQLQHQSFQWTPRTDLL